MFCTHSRFALAAALAALSLGACNCDPDGLNEPECKFVVNPHNQRPDDPPGADVRDLTFGEVRKGERRTRTITIDNTQSNVQLSQLQLSFSQVNSESYTVDGEIPTVNPGEVATITIAFSPIPIDGNVGNTLTVTHPNFDNKTCPTYTVTLLGRALPPLPPDAGPAPDAGPGDAGTDGGESDAGRDAGMVIPRADAGVPLTDAGHFEVRGGLQTARSEFGAALLPSGEILVVGGFDEAGQVLATTEIYDPHRGVSRFGPPLTSARARHSVTALPDGTILAFGGVSSGAPETAEVLESVEILAPDATEWMEVMTGQKRAGHLAVALTDAVLVAYGFSQVNAGQPLQPAEGAFLITANGSVMTVTAPMDAARARLGAAPVDMGDGTILFIGGQDPGTGAVLDAVVRYSAGALSTLAVTLETPRAFASAARFLNGPVVVTGGLGATGAVDQAEQLDPSVDEMMWAFTAVQGTIAPRLGAEMLRVLDDVILVSGGHEPLPADGGVLARQDAELFIHVQSLGVLSAGTVNDMSIPRVNAEAVPFDGGIAFLGGSVTTPRRSARPDVDTYRPALNKFETAGLIGPGGAVSGAAPQQIFVAGGTDLSTGRASARTRLYDIANERFTEGPSLLVARAEATATLLQNGDILIAGGTSTNGDPLAHGERHHSSLSQKEATGSMVLARRRHTATLLNDGRVLLCGGLGSGASALDGCEVFDPEDNTFSGVTGRMVRGRYDHTATLLDDGRVLLVGGNDPALGVFKADLFDPATDTITATAGRPQVARRGHVAVLVGAGKVLIAGGETFVGARVPTDTAEMFDAASEQFDALPDMAESREGAAAFLFGDGIAFITGGGQTVTNDPDFPTRALKRSEVFDPTLGGLGDFRNVDQPLNFPRARAVGETPLGLPTVLFGEGRHGIVAPGIEARVPLTTIEHWVE